MRYQKPKTGRQRLYDAMVSTVLSQNWRKWKESQDSGSEFFPVSREQLTLEIDYYTRNSKILLPSVWEYYTHASDHALDILERQVMKSTIAQLERKIDNYLVSREIQESKK